VQVSTATLKKLSETVGAEVLGASADQLVEDKALVAWCLRALEDNGVLVFRGLNIGDEGQRRFSQLLDEVDGVPAAESPPIYRITLDPKMNDSAVYLRGAFLWHIDGASDEVPSKATLLSGHVLSDWGGETEFASCYAAYEDLSDEEKERYGELRVVHSFERAQILANPDATEEEKAGWRARRPDIIHPLVWRHRSGHNSLVLGATAKSVEGMDRVEGEALLADLLERSTRPERVYVHEWTPGDLVIWDNRGVLHRAAPYDPESGRDMHRTSLAGDEPIQ
jgi:alpha-ketoglutarate-dependent taurine dioxygenase